MATIDELANQITANINATNELINLVMASKSTEEEVANQLNALGQYSAPQFLQQAGAKMDEAIAQIQAAGSNLGEAQQLVEQSRQA